MKLLTLFIKTNVALCGVIILILLFALAAIVGALAE